mmetsp:Transcript_44538/g.82003  ORF Transcript_44538/g.82003 Transcript_44538/m.82003 type:complete len:224 (+) Transcript_44538:1-672(+)
MHMTVHRNWPRHDEQLLACSPAQKVHLCVHTCTACLCCTHLHARRCGSGRSRILTPAVLLTHLCFLLRREIIDDVELLADFLSGLAFDHRCHLCTSEVQQALDVEIVCGKDELKENLLFNVHIFGVPLRNTALHEVGALQWLLDLLRWVVLVVLAVVNDLAEDGCLDIWQRNLLISTAVIHHVLDKGRHACNVGLHLKDLSLRRLELQHLSFSSHICNSSSKR